MDVKKHQTRTFSGAFVNVEDETPSQLRVKRSPTRIEDDRFQKWVLIIVFAILFVWGLVSYYSPDIPGT